MLTLVLGVGLGLLAGWVYFNEQSLEVSRLAEKNRRLLAASVASEQYIIDLETRTTVDRQALEVLRGSVVDLDRQIFEANKELKLYRNLVKGDAGSDVRISDFSLARAVQPNTYRYRFVLRKTKNLSRTETVDVQISVEGRTDGELLSYSWAKLDPGVDNSVLRRKLRYFQTVAGVFVLPPGFDPARIVVEAWPAARRKQHHRMILAWTPTVEDSVSRDSGDASDKAASNYNEDQAGAGRDRP